MLIFDSQCYLNYGIQLLRGFGKEVGEKKKFWEISCRQNPIVVQCPAHFIPNGDMSRSPGLVRGTSAYPGHLIENRPQPQRGCVASRRRADTTPLGLKFRIEHRPRVGRRTSGQPWASGQNPVGIPTYSPHSGRKDLLVVIWLMPLIKPKAIFHVGKRPGRKRFVAGLCDRPLDSLDSIPELTALGIGGG